MPDDIRGEVPLGKGARHDRGDAFMRILKGIDVEWDAREEEIEHAAGMVEMPMRDDDVAQLGAVEADKVELARELQPPAGVDQERLAAARGDDHAGHRPRRIERSAGAKQGDLHAGAVSRFRACA